MSGNTFGQLFTVTTFGESHGPALGCIVDGCPPGLDARRGGHPARCRAAPLRHFAVTPASARNPIAVRILSGVFEGRTTGHADRPARREHRPALVRLRKDQGPLPSRPRRLHLPAEIRLARLPRRRPLLGARNGHARRGRRDRAQVPARATAASTSAATSPDGRASRLELHGPRPASTTIRSSAPSPRACRSSRPTSTQLRRDGDSVGARVTVVATGVPPGWASRCSTGSMPTSRTR